MKRDYETLFIIANKEDEQIEKIIETVKEFISSSGGEIQNVDKWGNKRLCYEIKKNKIGFYTLINFESEAKNISALENYYKNNEDVIRSIVVRKSKK
jgi:small subunit ribosomal protein S6